MAQLAEQLICNQQVIGSSPIIGLTLLKRNFNIAGWSSLEARRAHNPKVVGSNPAPATRTKYCVYAQIAQSVEQRIENPRVTGSIPVLGIFLYDLHIGRDGRVAQVVEHLTFNQVVRGSNPRTLMQTSKNFKGSCFFCFIGKFSNLKI